MSERLSAGLRKLRWRKTSTSKGSGIGRASKSAHVEDRPGFDPRMVVKKTARGPIESSQSLTSKGIGAVEDGYMEFLYSTGPFDPFIEVTRRLTHTWHLDMIDQPHDLELRTDGDKEEDTLQWKVTFRGSLNSKNISVYLHAPPSWQGLVRFAVVLLKPDDPSRYLARDLIHYFRPDQTSWGFRSFCRGIDLAKTIGMFDRKVNIKVDLKLLRAHKTSSCYGLSTGRQPVGIKNMGNTGWLSVALQIYYPITAYKILVHDAATGPTPTEFGHALAHTFTAMRSSTTAVLPDKLLEVGGWPASKPRDIQDVISEWHTSLMPEMSEHGLSNLFAIKGRDLSGKRPKSYTELSLCLNVKGYRALSDSLRAYTNPSKQPIEHGRWPTRQTTTIDHLPPIVHFFLNRIEYEPRLQRHVKIQDLFEYPEQIDLAPFMSESAEPSSEMLYRLISVAVHEGADGGVGYAYVRPTRDGPFFRFHDEFVTPATEREVFETNFGGDCGDSSEAMKMACVLLYAHVSRLDEVFGSD
ncbi:hypothetical protein BJY04DRAFT_185506 [Aspergillus karnatakaensis]|uniref:uncharacterized protein n=1 Tax=Aspergillus karnatakaensis TaxID=1810916 RepID=UPI003CCE24AD